MEWSLASIINDNYALLLIYLGFPLVGFIFFSVLLKATGRPILTNTDAEDLVIYWFRNLPIEIIIAYLFIAVLKFFIPLHYLQFVSISTLPVTFQVLLFYFFIEFGTYFLHRALHQIQFLRPLHVTHHTSYSLSWTNAHKDGIPVMSFEVFFVVLASMTLSVHPVAVALAVILYLLLSALSHIGVNWKFGRLDWFFLSPHRHNHHHELVQKAIIGQKVKVGNFGGSLSFFDFIFGTLR